MYTEISTRNPLYQCAGVVQPRVCRRGSGVQVRAAAARFQKRDRTQQRRPCEHLFVPHGL